MSQTTRPESDPLTELLATFPLPINFAGSMTLTAPWRLTVPQNVVLFGVLTGSKCWLSDSGTEEAVAIAPSDFIAITPACGCELSSDREACAVAVDELVRNSAQASSTSLTCGGGGAQTGLIGGMLEFNERGTHPLFTALPPVLHLSRSSNGDLSKLGLTLYAIEREVSSGQPGTRAIVSYLAQALLIQAARLYLTESGGGIARSAGIAAPRGGARTGSDPQPAGSTLDRGISCGTGKHVAIQLFGKLHENFGRTARAIPARATDACSVPLAAGFNNRLERGVVSRRLRLGIGLQHCLQAILRLCSGRLAASGLGRALRLSACQEKNWCWFSLYWTVPRSPPMRAGWPIVGFRRRIRTECLTHISENLWLSYVTSVASLR